MAVDRATVAHIAALARIRLSEGELEPLANELSRILDWIEQLNEVDTSAAMPLASVVAARLPMREDRVTDGACRDAILANAPRTAPSGGKAGFFAVPKVIE
jgi:aspartyl-tRNA(Asn)/glutamyl-tRNA(Gln) amidotransferase subunit C